jgi:hypothetical protein
MPHGTIPFFALKYDRGLMGRLGIRTAIGVLLLAIAVVSFPERAWAWGCEGHQVVALLAEKHLSAHALAKVKQILADSPIDPTLTRFCKEGGVDALSDASTWADDFRTQHPETGPWHYVDIPLGTKLHDIEKFCDPQESCVTRAITDQLAILRSSEPGPQKLADALRFLIHFVGDLHQPLHATTNNDQGGNCVPVEFFGTSPQVRNPQTESYAPNLHGIWDTNILGKATSGKTVDQVAADLDQSYRKKIARWQHGSANIDEWGWESYRLAAKKAYGKLPLPIPVESPQPIKSCADDNHVSTRMLKLNERIEKPYQEMAAPVVNQQLTKAGARLALLLNQLWP